jgi:hypothetical protein
MLAEESAVHLQLNVPIEHGEALRNRGHCLPTNGATRKHEKAGAACTAPGQPIKFGIGHLIVHHGDESSAISEVGDGVELARVVHSVGGRLHHHDALRTQGLLHLAVLGHGGVRRQ